MKKKDVVVFQNIDNKIYCNHNILFSYFVSDIEWNRQYVKIKPLTLGFLLESTVKNQAIISWWSFLRLLWKAGFIDIPESEKFSWRYFRLTFWKSRKNS